MPQNFFELVYAAVAQVPRGRVTTYSAVAKYLGNPRGSRAVGWAMRQCPYSLAKIPCHRVIKADGSIGGFGQEGARMKISLLRKEGIPVRKGQVPLDLYFFDQFRLRMT